MHSSESDAGEKMVRMIVGILMLVFTMEVQASVLMLSSEGDIRDIEMLDSEVDRLVAKVRQCAAAGLAPVSDCFCYYPAKLASARSAFNRVLVKHPDWEDRSIRWRDNRQPDQLHLGGLKKRIQQPCT